jgi:peroxiredoxin
VARAFDAMGTRSFAQRKTFVIDQDWILRAIVDRVDVRAHGDDLVTLIEALKKNER